MFGKQKKEKEPEKESEKKKDVTEAPKLEEPEKNHKAEPEAPGQEGVSAEDIKRWNFAVHLFKRVSQKEFDPMAGGINGLKDEYELFKARKAESLTKYMAYETVVSNATDTLDYYVLLVLSCIIATMGLIQNSAAVIIGAMIVAPLMGPILGLSAGVMWGSREALWESVTTLAKGVLVVLLISSGVAFFLPYIALNSEILSRTHPGILDVVVALASGVIGSYAYVNNRISSSIPGVAISVALMPPLCTAGIGLGLLNMDVLRGGLILFFVNLVGISTAAAVVFYIVKLHPKTYNDEGKELFVKRFASQLVLSLVLLVLLCIPLGIFTVTAFNQGADKQHIKTMLEEELGGENIYDLSIIPEDDGYKVVVIQYLETTVPEGMEETLVQKTGKPLNLKVYHLTSEKLGTP